MKDSALKIIRSHVTNAKTFISTVTRLTATKLGRVVTSARMFRTQTPKSSPTSC